VIKSLHSLLCDDHGQGLAEYGLILGLVAVVCVTATQTLGSKISTSLTNTGTKLP
jgi:pilus assembly protein Flp/PilA